jgi:hypothetical protein
MEERRRTDPLMLEIRDDLKQIRGILTGNGKIGLCEKVRVIDSRLDKIEKRPLTIKGWLVSIAIIISALSAIVSTISIVR